MALVSGFEYDIFISYRHNDNRSGWVADFVNALQEELAATIKEPLSIYFDKNPHNGLLETHNVDKSLEGKLKCLIFIPILSQTYCDAKSFAWQNEFCAFNRMAKEDQLGRDIRLNTGNVASRILPIKIHDLDDEDIAVLRNETGGMVRAVEFIYKEPGVNRPLKLDDKKEDNALKTSYRNQVNKVANAIKAILGGTRQPFAPGQIAQTLTSNETQAQENSIVVLPFVNMSNDPEQEYFSDGLTEELITELSMHKDLLVISRSSAMTFKASGKMVKEIAREVNVRYVLEGSVRKAGNSLRITAQLIDSNSDSHLWAEKYNGVLEDVFEIQERVSLSIVKALKLKLTETNRITSNPIRNIQAFECFLKARQELYRGTKENMELTFKLVQNAIELVGPNELLYATLGFANYFYFRFVDKLDDSYLRKAGEYARKVFELNPQSAHGHVIDGWIHTTRGNLQESVRSMKRALSTNPVNQEALLGISASLIWAGRCSDTAVYARKLLEIDPLTPFNHIVNGGYRALDGQPREALPYFEKAYQLDPKSLVNIWQLASAYIWCEQNEKAFPLINELIESAPDWPVTKQVQFLKYGLEGNREGALRCATHELEAEAKNDPHFAFHLAECYAVIDYRKQALDYLEMAIEGFYPYRFLSANPLFRSISAEQRFELLIQKAKEKSEALEV